MFAKTKYCLDNALNLNVTQTERLSIRVAPMLGSDSNGLILGQALSGLYWVRH